MLYYLRRVIPSISLHTKPSQNPQFKTTQNTSYSFPSFTSPLTMSDKCGNCDCADKSQCVKKGNSLVLMTESYTEFPEVSMVAEHDPKCKCGSTCTCTDCGCGK